MKNKLLILIFVFLFLFIQTITTYALEGGTNYSTNPADYLLLDRFNRADSTTIGKAETGITWTEKTGDPEISNYKVLFNGNEDIMINLHNDGAGADLTENYTCDIYLSASQVTTVPFIWYSNEDLNGGSGTDSTLFTIVNGGQFTYYNSGWSPVGMGKVASANIWYLLREVVDITHEKTNYTVYEVRDANGRLSIYENASKNWETWAATTEGVSSIYFGADAGNTYVDEIACWNWTHNSTALTRPPISTYTTFSNYVYFNNTNYVRTLNYTVTLNCTDSNEVINVSLYVNKTNVRNELVSCTIPYTVYKNTYTPTKDNVIFNATIYTNDTHNYAYNMTFLSDIANPTIKLNMTDVAVFNVSITNLTMTCSDKTFFNITYNMSFNGNVTFTGNLTNGTLKYNDTLSYVDGANILIGKCSDMFGTSTKTLNNTVHSKTLYLIDEIANTIYDLDNCSEAKVYLDNNRTVFDFKARNMTAVNFTSTNYYKLRFVIEREDESGNDIKITKYIDASLLGDIIRVCVNKDGVQEYEQLILSATEKGVILKNLYSNCVIAADYTRFAYQDSLLLKAFTINGFYYLYTYDDGNTVYLTSLDGSISTYINVDQLEFGATAYDLNILGDAITFYNQGGTVKIYYLNKENDNTDLSLTITNMLTNVEVYTLDDFDDNNEFTIYFNYATLNNVTNETVFQLDLVRTTDEGESTLTRYFNIGAQGGILRASLAVMLGFLLSVFGLSLAATRLTLSWFGALIMIASIALLSFAISTWYILLLMVIDAIVLIYIILMTTIKNYATLT